MTDILEAARQRSAGMPAVAARPSQRGPADKLNVVRSTLASASIGATVKRNGLDAVRVGGYASTTETYYEMYDAFGPYKEIVARGAFGATLAADPLVEYNANHGAGGSFPMASTRNGTLDLSEDNVGLAYDAYVNPVRPDVQILILALERGDVAESSFKFRITEGEWSPDFTEFRILSVDLDHGDVSTVNYGANPTTTSQLRQLSGKLKVGRALDAEDVNMLTQAMAWFTAIDSIVDEAQEAIAGYLKVPSPDPDDATVLSLSTKTPARSVITDDDVRVRVL